MNWIAFTLFFLPLIAQPAPPEQVIAARDRANVIMSAAAAQLAEYQPQWEVAAREELEDYPEYTEELLAAIRAASEETGLEPSLLWAVIYTESRGRHFNKNGRVKRGGSKEVGVMQVMPFWERSLKRVYDIEVDLFDLSDNVRSGAYVLTRGGDELRVMLSYYNTGKRIRSTRYQRKVMKYLAKLKEPGSLQESSS